MRVRRSRINGQSDGSIRSGRHGLRRKARSFSPDVEGVERRLVLNAGPSVAHLALASHSGTVTTRSDSLNQRVVQFLSSKVGKRIGGGECSHLASEALRVAGAKFISHSRNPNSPGSDSPGSGDYDWGTLIKKVTFTGGRVDDSNPSASVKAGDVIQYRNAAFSTGSRASHHTSVVAAVDAQGRVTKVYEQNLGNNGVKGRNRTVTLRSLDLSKLNGGWVRIYRPEARSNQSGLYEYSIVNNSSSSQTIRSSSDRTYSFTAANTADSYRTFLATGGPPSVTLNGRSYRISNGAGYEIVGSGSSATLRKLNP